MYSRKRMKSSTKKPFASVATVVSKAGKVDRGSVTNSATRESVRVCEMGASTGAKSGTRDWPSSELSHDAWRASAVVTEVRRKLRREGTGPSGRCEGLRSFMTRLLVTGRKSDTLGDRRRPGGAHGLRSDGRGLAGRHDPPVDPPSGHDSPGPGR